MASLASAGASNVSALHRPPTPQLPVAWYVDPAFHRLEQQVLANGPTYIGHQLMASQPGDYHVLDWMGQAKALVHNTQGVELISNVCRHRQAVMLEGKGHAHNIVCPLHRWTYDLSGELMGAPHFAENPCLHLNKSALQNWQGLLFEGKRDVAKDLDLAINYAAKARTPLLTSGLVRQMLSAASEAGYGREDFSSLAKVVRQLAGM